MTRRVPSTSTGECPAIEFASKYSAQLHRRSPDRRSLGDGTCLIAIQLPTQPSDRLNVPAPVFPDNRPTALRVMPFPGFGVAKSPRGRAVRRQARPNIFENCEACCGFFKMRDLEQVPDHKAPLAQRASPAGTKSGSWGGDDVAVRPSRHQAILHLAGRRQIMGQPQSERQDRNRDRQPGDRSTPVSALFGIGHLSVSPGNG